MSASGSGQFIGSTSPFVVVGMYRSGTSMVARCLSEMGAYFGDQKDHFPTDQYNPGGYYEVLELMEVNRQALGFFGLQHLRVEEIPDHWPTLPDADAMTNEICQTVRKHFGGQSRWGFKEPQVTPLLPVYQEVFTTLGLDPLYVVCVRNPLDVMGTNMLPKIGDGIVGVWLNSTLSALRWSRGKPRVVIPYESFLANPRPYLEAVAAMAPDWPLSEADFQQALSTVHPEWRTNKRDESGLAEWPAIVRDVLEVARACAADSKGFQEGAYDAKIDRLWEDWQHLHGMVKTRSIPHGRLTLMEQGDEAQKTEEWIVPTGGWQTVSVAIPTTKEPGLLMEVYQNPAVVWIRNAKLKGPSGEVPARISQTVHGELIDRGRELKLIQWGWFPLFLHLPTGFKPEVLEMEIYVQWNVYAVEDSVHHLRNAVSKFWQEQD